MPGGRPTNTKNRPKGEYLRRLLKRENHDPARNEGAHGGTRGSPVKASEAKLGNP